MDRKSSLAGFGSLPCILAVLACAWTLTVSSTASAQAEARSGPRATGAPGAGTTSAQRAPADSGFGEQWDLLNSGQFSGTAGDDVNAARAWDIEPGGNAAVTVGLVDSGVEFAQPSLAHANLYTQGTHAGGASTSASTASCATASYGCSFVGAGGTPNDESGHGTATAGEIFAGWDEGTYAGLAPESTLIVAKVLDGASHGTTAQEAEGLDYVADRGARVVNVSIAGPRSVAVHEAIASHPQTLFVAAAGNAGADDDGSSPSYPCADPSPNVICVAASDTDDRLASFSNYGASSVDLAAPGVQIATLTREGNSNAFSGTSFAAPLVTGVAALAFALRPNASAAQVKRAILESVDARATLSGKTLTGGRLDAYRALTDLIALSPAAPPASTSAPVLSGVAATGAELVASAGTWSGAPDSTAISWERCDSAGGHCQLIAGASGARFTPSAPDAGQTLRAEVLATSSAGSEIAFSATSGVVGAPASPAGATSAGFSVSASTRTATTPVGATAAGSSAARTSAGSAQRGAPAVSSRATAATSPVRVTVSVKLLANGSRLLRVSLRSQSAKSLSLSLLTRVGRKSTVAHVALARGASRTLSVELPREHSASRAYVLLSGAGLLVKRTVAIG